MALAYALPTERSRTQFPPEAIVLANNPAQAFAKAKSPFGGLASEREFQMDAPEHESDPKLARIIEMWAMYLTESKTFGGMPVESRYNEAKKIIADANCSASDLEAFVEVLRRYQDEPQFFVDTGVFISALINCGPDQRYVVRAECLDARIDYLGCFNTKEVVIYGNVGGEVGREMRSGSLTVYGNAGRFSGYEMNGGVLTITGDVEGELGILFGGEICVGGKCKVQPKYKYDSSVRVFVGGVELGLEVVGMQTLYDIRDPEMES